MNEKGINLSKIDQEFEKYIYDGIKNRNLSMTDGVSRRLKHEISVIENMKMTDYILMAYDLTQYMKKKGIYTGGVALGSENCSLINYLLGITDINPLEYNLPFERFINPQRVAVPDFLIGVQADKLNFVEEYLITKYKGKIRKNVYQVDEINYTRDEYYIDFLNNGTDQKISIVPMKNLKMISDILKSLKYNKLKDIPQNDKKVFDVLNSENELYTSLEKGEEEFLKSFEPKSINDIALAYSLYRPSPLIYGIADTILKNKKKSLNTYNNDIFENILKESYGIPIYQEQVIEILSLLFDTTLDNADMYRRMLLKNDELITKKLNQKLGQDESTDKIIKILLNYSSAYFMKSAAIANAILIYKLCYLQVYYKHNKICEEYATEAEIN